MPTYEVTLSDGRKFAVESDGPPSEADILAQLGPTKAPTEAPGFLDNAWNDAAGIANAVRHPIDTARSMMQAKTDTEAEWASQPGLGSGAMPPLPDSVGEMGGNLLQAGRAALQGAYEQPVSTALMAAPMMPWGRMASAAGDAASAAGRGAAAAGRGAATMAGKVANSTPAAVAMDVAELAMPRTTRALSGGATLASKLAQRFGSSAPAAPPAGSTVQLPPMLDALMKGAGYDELAALAPKRAPGAPAAAAAAAPPTGQAALASEVAARQALDAPINWRTTDATPIKKPGKGIHFGEESTPGLLKLLQDALLANNKPLAEKIQTAIRQRSHITGKVGEP